MYVFIATRRMHSKNCLLCSLCEESQLLLTFHNQANKLLAEVWLQTCPKKNQIQQRKCRQTEP